MTALIKDLWYRYPSCDNWTLRAVNFHLGKGEVVCITGPSGSGKTTLCMCLNGLIPHHVRGEMRGDVTLDGKCTRGYSIAEFSQSVGIVFQNPETQLFLLRVMDEVAFGPENLGVPPHKIAERVMKALENVGIRGMEEENPEHLSMGQKQRVAIASVLSMQPRVLVLDEPFSQLDQRGREKLLDTLKKLKSQRVSIVITEHNLDPLMDLTDRLVVMSNGEITFDKPVKRLSSDDIASIRRNGVRWRLSENSHYSKSIPRSCTCPGDYRIWVEHVSYRYPNGTEALRNVSVRVGPGEFLGLVGENSSGKSTLLKCMIGLLKPKQGRIVVTGIEDPTPESLFGRVGVLLQNSDCQLFEETVFNEVAFSLRKMGVAEHEVAERVGYALKAVKMTDHAWSNPLMLSLGEKRRITLASILAMRPKVILLDELTHGLDIRNTKRIVDILKFMQENMKTTVLMSSHDHELLAIYANTIVEMRDGYIEDLY